MSSIISVQLDAVAALAAELAALAAELDEEAALCRSTASSFASALPGENGRAAADAATAWSGLTAVVAERGRAVAATLAAAVASYRAIDTALAGRMDPRRAGDLAMPR